jgi:hypothetical protein
MDGSQVLTARLKIPAAAATDLFFFPNGYRSKSNEIWVGGGRIVGLQLEADETSRYSVEIHRAIDTSMQPKIRLTTSAGGVNNNAMMPGAQKEVQLVSHTGTGGTLDLIFEGQTATIAWNANAATVKSALEGLSNITTVTVTGAGTPANPWVVTFDDPLGNVEQMTLDTSSLTPAGSTGLVVTQQDGNWQHPFAASISSGITLGTQSLVWSQRLVRPTGVEQFGYVPMELDMPSGMIVKITPGASATASNDDLMVMFRPYQSGRLRQSAQRRVAAVGF